MWMACLSTCTAHFTARSSTRSTISRSIGVTYADIQHWKRQSGYNDDWRLTTDWVNELGEESGIRQGEAPISEILLGREWQARQCVARTLAGAAAAPGALGQARGTGPFHGPNAARVASHTLDRFGVADLFRRVVTMDDVERLKPDPEGLHFLLDGADPRRLYLGDNLDDALAAKSARVPFFGMLPRGSDAQRVRAGSCAAMAHKMILRQHERTGEILEMRRAACIVRRRKRIFACA